MEHTPMTLDAARVRLERWVRTTRWLYRGYALRMEVRAFRSLGARHLSWEQHYETRSVGKATRLYGGGEVDGPERGATPDLWAVAVSAPTDFVEETQVVAMPHTSHVATCHGCQGRGRVACGPCNGNGRVSCANCNGSGRCACGSCGGSGHSNCGGCGGGGTTTRSEPVTSTDANGVTSTTYETRSDPCGSCGGSGHLSCGTCGASGSVLCGGCGGGGTVTCSGCGGAGDVVCGLCEGHGRLEHYDALTIKRTHAVHTATLDGGALPDRVVREATGALEHEASAVTLTESEALAGHRLDDTVANALRSLVATHPRPMNAKALRERARVRSVPVHEGVYVWGGRAQRFYVYGFDERVYAPDFPRSPWRTGAAVLAVVVAVLAVFAALSAWMSS